MLKSKKLETSCMREQCIFQNNQKNRKGLIMCFKNYVLSTIHRAETRDNLDNLKSVIKALNEINLSNAVIMPIHPRNAFNYKRQ